jgi:AraC-like DNA-binding protein
MQILADGGYAISERIDIDGAGSSYFVFARGWLLEILDLERGEYYFFSDGAEVRPPSKRFGIYYPPFTITRPFVSGVVGTVHGVGSTEVIPELPSTALMFDTDFAEDFVATSQAVDVLERSTNHRSIEVNSRRSLVTLKAKRLIDENYLVFPSISRIATRLSVTPEHLSRQFKRDLGITPSGYLHKLRVADATFRLSMGEPIVDISQDVGYNDLSRFYKQFRKATHTSPAACRKQVSRR